LLIAKPGAAFHDQGLLHVSQGGGELWRSRFDAERNLVVINNHHRDFVYAARNKMLEAPPHRSVSKSFAEESRRRSADQLLEACWS
jgi:hypothetical protein